MKNMFKGNLYALTMRAVEAALGKETAQRITEEAFAEYLRTKPMHDIKEALNKSRHASYLLIFRHIARKLLEIHQVFLRHFRTI